MKGLILKGFLAVVVTSFSLLVAPAAKAQVNNTSQPGSNALVTPVEGNSGITHIVPGGNGSDFSGVGNRANQNSVNTLTTNPIQNGGGAKIEGIQSSAAGGNATSAGGDVKVEAPKPINLHLGGSATTPSTFGQGGGVEVICDNRSFTVEGTVESRANNFLGLVATGRSKPGILPGSDEVISQALECSKLEQIKEVNSSSLLNQVSYLLQIAPDEAIAFVHAKLLVLGFDYAAEEQHFTSLVQRAKTPDEQRVAVLYGIRVLVTSVQSN